MSPSIAPCAACKFQRRKCTEECIFAPYFPASQPKKFEFIHRVFGASNVSKLLNELDVSQREAAVHSLAYEAEMRLRDPVYGVVGSIALLQNNLKMLLTELAMAKRELATYMAPQNLFPMIQQQQQQAVGFMGKPPEPTTPHFMRGHQMRAGPSAPLVIREQPQQLEAQQPQHQQELFYGQYQQELFDAQYQQQLFDPHHQQDLFDAQEQQDLFDAQKQQQLFDAQKQQDLFDAQKQQQLFDAQRQQELFDPQRQQELFDAHQQLAVAAAREQQQMYRRHHDMKFDVGGFDMVAAGGGGSGYVDQGDLVSSSLSLGRSSFEGPFEGHFHQIQESENPHTHQYLQPDHLSLQQHQMQMQQQYQMILMQQQQHPMIRRQQQQQYPFTLLQEQDLSILGSEREEHN